MSVFFVSSNKKPTLTTYIPPFYLALVIDRVTALSNLGNRGFLERGVLRLVGIVCSAAG